MDIATVSNTPQQFCVMSATQTFVDSHHTINHNQSINQSQVFTQLSHICIVVRMLFLNATVPCIFIPATTFDSSWSSQHDREMGWLLKRQDYTDHRPRDGFRRQLIDE